MQHPPPLPLRPYSFLDVCFRLRRLVQKTISISTQVVDCFFKLYPEIKEKHDEMVKTPQDNAKFWWQVLNSHYFNREKTDTDSG